MTLNLQLGPLILKGCVLSILFSFLSALWFIQGSKSSGSVKIIKMIITMTLILLFIKFQKKMMTYFGRRSFFGILIFFSLGVTVFLMWEPKTIIKHFNASSNLSQERFVGSKPLFVESTAKNSSPIELENVTIALKIEAGTDLKMNGTLNGTMDYKFNGITGTVPSRMPFKKNGSLSIGVPTVKNDSHPVSMWNINAVKVKMGFA